MHPSSWSRFINSSYTLPPVKLSNCRHGVLFEKYWLSIASKFGRHNMIPESFHNVFVSLFKYCSYTIILTLQGSRQRWGQSGYENFASVSLSKISKILLAPPLQWSWLGFCTPCINNRCGWSNHANIFYQISSLTHVSFFSSFPCEKCKKRIRYLKFYDQTNAQCLS